MKIIILAAGRGERLLPLTRNTPKPLLDLGNGNTLLEEQLQSIRASGRLEEVVLVIGYLAAQVEAKMGYYRSRGYKIRTLFNPFYEVSNNFMSLWLAKQLIEEDDVMITNGDNLFAPRVFADFAAETNAGIYLALGRKEKFELDDMKATVTDGMISEVSKQIPDDVAHAESPGLALVRGSRARTIFVENLEKMARTGGYLNRFWLEVFSRLYEQGVMVTPWWFDSGNLWNEVDLHLDLSRARDLLAARLNAPPH